MKTAIQNALTNAKLLRSHPDKVQIVPHVFMKAPMRWFRMLAGMSALLAAATLAAAELHILTPVLDSSGRFWVYRNGAAKPHLPFLPYGWMSDGAPTNVLKLDLETRDETVGALRVVNPGEANYCITISVTWTQATWAGIAFISGPDNPGWWGETNRGRYFDLRGLAKKTLILHARSDRAGNQFRVQFGILGDRPFGDSLSKPFKSDSLELTTQWQRHEIELKSVAAQELGRICNGFGVLIERSLQAGAPSETRIYLDDIYFE